jgi:hypothetical protein
MVGKDHRGKSPRIFEGELKGQTNAETEAMAVKTIGALTTPTWCMHSGGRSVTCIQ